MHGNWFNLDRDPMCEGNKRMGSSWRRARAKIEGSAYLGELLKRSLGF